MKKIIFIIAIIAINVSSFAGGFKQLEYVVDINTTPNVHYTSTWCRQQNTGSIDNETGWVSFTFRVDCYASLASGSYAEAAWSYGVYHIDMSDKIYAVWRPTNDPLIQNGSGSNVVTHFCEITNPNYENWWCDFYGQVSGSGSQVKFTTLVRY